LRLRVDNRELDAEFDVVPSEESDCDFEMVLHSRGNQRNPDYGAALAALLEWLAIEGCYVIRISVDSPIARGLSLRERTLSLEYPILFDDVGTDFGELRRRISRVQRTIGQRSGAKEGNGTRRIRISVVSRGSHDHVSFGKALTTSHGMHASHPQAMNSERSGAPAGQGYGLSKEQKDAVEQRAMLLAADHLLRLGWPTVEDKSRSHPYDLHCIDGRRELFVEVKGTTSGGTSVLLTAGEVQVQRVKYPSNALIIVSGIRLAGAVGSDATEGSVMMVSPWRIDESRLEATQFRLNVVGLFAGELAGESSRSG
jgi:hypothetical protein